MDCQRTQDLEGFKNRFKNHASNLTSGQKDELDNFKALYYLHMLIVTHSLLVLKIGLAIM